jgi:hypothetical protein
VHGTWAATESEISAICDIFVNQMSVIDMTEAFLGNCMSSTYSSFPSQTFPCPLPHQLEHIRSSFTTPDPKHSCKVSHSLPPHLLSFQEYADRDRYASSLTFEDSSRISFLACRILRSFASLSQNYIFSSCGR